VLDCGWLLALKVWPCLLWPWLAAGIRDGLKSLSKSDFVRCCNCDALYDGDGNAIVFFVRGFKRFPLLSHWF